MKLSFILLQAASWSLKDSLLYQWNNSGVAKWIVGIVLFFIVRSVCQWALGITKIAQYHREGNILLSQQNELLQRQIDLLEKRGL